MNGSGFSCVGGCLAKQAADDLQTEGGWIVWSVRALEASVAVILVFRVSENRDGSVGVERDVVFQMRPFVVIDLDNECLGAAVLGAIGRAFLDVQIADFLGENSAFGSPRDQDGVGIGVDHAEFFGGGFELIGHCPRLVLIVWSEAGHTAGDDARFVPLVRFSTRLPDSVLEERADGVE